MRDEEKELEYYQNVARDTGKKYLREVSKLSRIISQLKETEETLQKYKILVESSSDAIFMLDRDRKIISFNKAFLTCFGYRENEVKDRTLNVIMKNAGEYAQLEEVFRQIIHKRGAHILEWQFVKRDGSRITMEATISCIETGILTLRRPG